MGSGRLNLKYGLTSQTAGLLPLLVLMFLNNFYSYLISFIIAVVFCLGSILLFWGLYRERTYQFMLIPTALTFVLYSVFLFFRIEPVLYIYSPLITEWLLVAVLSVIGSLKRFIAMDVRKSTNPVTKYPQFRTALGEFFYVAQIIQNLYTFHLFILLFYMILSESHPDIVLERFLYHEAPLAIGIIAIGYEQIRLFMIKRNLSTEEWLPVLDKKGKIIGRTAYSVSIGSHKKQCHPVVRVAVICNDMFYLAKSDERNPVSPETLDYPFSGYVLFNQTLEQAVKNMIEKLFPKDLLNPRFLVRYLFENEKICSLVSLYAVFLHTEEDFMKYIGQLSGKLWTQKQIEANLGKGIYSEYFEKEYPYLQNTILQARQYIVKPPSK